MITRKKYAAGLKWMVLLLAAVLILSACGKKQDGNLVTQEETNSSESQAAESGFPRTINDSTGDVTIPKKPERVAVVHWGYLDSILLFDLDSVGVALPFTQQNSVLESDAYKPYADSKKELVVVGENTMVDLEALLAYEPDIIIAGNAINAEVAADLGRIATTVIIDEEAASVWTDWPSVVTKLGEILGQEESAENYISDFRKLLEDGKNRLANVEGDVAFVQVRGDTVWLQGSNFLNHYYEGLGLKASGNQAAAEGGQISLEGLAELNPEHLFLGYFNKTNAALGALTDEWESSKVWTLLEAVKKNQTYDINGELALGFGPIGQTYGIQAVIEALDPS